MRNPSWENAGYLGLDVASAFIPFVTGSGAIAKGIAHGDDALKAVKGIIGHGDDIVKSGSKLAIKHPNSFRGKLQKLTSMSDEMAGGMEAHHILPQKFKSFFEGAWEKAGLKFDINNPEWGKWVSKDQHGHRSWSYNEEWSKWIEKHRRASVDEILEKAREMANYIK